MIKTGLNYLLITLFFVSCGVEASDSNNTASEETSTEESHYEFKEGEAIHWEAANEGDFIIIKAWLNTDWHTYSVHNTNFLGPLPTLISFDENDSYELVGEIEEEGLKNKYYDEWESDLNYFEGLAIFKQKIKSISGEEFVVSGNVNYMICNSTNCLPPADYNFELTVKP